MNTRPDTTKVHGTPDVPHAHEPPRMGIRVFSAACLLFALLFYYYSVLGMPLKQTNLLDLGPYPDAVEYFAQANSILETGKPAIQIGYDRLPSRYPPGYPILMLPWLKCLPHNGILAPFRTNQTIGLLLLFGIFGFYLAIHRPLAAGLSVLLLASQPAFFTFSRSSMSDLSGGAATLLSFSLVYFAFKRRRRGLIYAAAVILGVALSIRTQMILFAPLLIAMAFFPDPGSWRKWFFHCVMTLIVFALAASPYFILNWMQFGNPLKTGYDFWVPGTTDTNAPFAVHNILPQLTLLWSEATAHWNQFRVANLFGTGTHVVPAFVLLVLAGGAFVHLGRFEISALVSIAAFLLGTITYQFVDARFYLPLFFLLIPIAVLAAEWATNRLARGHYSIAACGITAVFLFSCAGFPSESGFPPQNRRAQIWDALLYRNQRGGSLCYEMQRAFIKSFGGKPSLVVSEIDPAYLNALWPADIVAAPLDEKHNYPYSKTWRYGKAEAANFVRTAISTGLPAYALLVRSKEGLELARLPVVEGFHWEDSGIPVPYGAVMILCAGQAPDSLSTSKRDMPAMFHP